MKKITDFNVNNKKVILRCDFNVSIKDGKIFTALVRGNDSRKEFFNKIIEVVTLLGGDRKSTRLNSSHL